MDLVKSDKLCECGCGEYTHLAYHTNAAKGWVKGEPMRFCMNHNTRKTTKVCKKCKKEQPWPDNFYKRGTNPSGRPRYHIRCKSCENTLNSQRRKRYRHLAHDLTPQQWAVILRHYDSKCAYCGSKELISKDCVIPQRRGGPYTRANVVPACKSCNSSKSGKNVKRWMNKRGFDYEAFEARRPKYD